MRFKVAFGAIAVIIITAAGIFSLLRQKSPISADLLRCLRGKGTVVVQWKKNAIARGNVPGTKLVPIESLPRVRSALTGKTVATLQEMLERAKASGMLVSPRINFSPIDKGSLGEQLSSYQYVPGFKALCLDAETALYITNPQSELPPESKTALAAVARALLGGVESPQVSSFPEPLRRPRTSEVMVTLLQNDAPRLWRSARGSSIARALITAATVARRRWNERGQTLGGRLDDLLPKMDIDVSLLQDDGTLLSREPGFIDRVITPVHGIGYEYKNAWQFLLPEAILRKGKGSAARAYQRLLESEGLPSRDFQDRQLRLYRIVVIQLARSDGLSRKAD